MGAATAEGDRIVLLVSLYNMVAFIAKLDESWKTYGENEKYCSNRCSQKMNFEAIEDGLRTSRILNTRTMAQSKAEHNPT